jgi:hypothetical protein
MCNSVRRKHSSSAAEAARCEFAANILILWDSASTSFATICVLIDGIRRERRILRPFSTALRLLTDDLKVFQRDFHGGSRPWSCHITD